MPANLGLIDQDYVIGPAVAAHQLPACADHLQACSDSSSTRIFKHSTFGVSVPFVVDNHHPIRMTHSVHSPSLHDKPACSWSCN